MNNSLNSLPLLQELDAVSTILLAGMGGGYDVFATLPLYYNLIAKGKNVHLANYTFTHRQTLQGEEEIYPGCFRVGPAGNEFQGLYFPEKYLAQWLEINDCNPTVYALETRGVKPLFQNYSKLCKKLGIDAIVLVDGGTDGLMFGDEEHLGTPLQDYTSIAAVHQVDGVRKYMGCIGYGIDDVSHNCFWDNVRTLEHVGGSLGTVQLDLTFQEAQLYCNAVDHANLYKPGDGSIINNAIACAIQGNLGCASMQNRTRAHSLQIESIMARYWFFKLDSLVSQTKYYHLIKDTVQENEVNVAIRLQLPRVAPMRKTIEVDWRSMVGM